jgi:trafficking protein particle complex subunit 11
VKAIINNNLTICCRVESPAIMEDLAIWKYENMPETYPAADPALSLSGQKFVQVEESNPLVDLTLNSTGPALVGEVFRIPVHVVSTGHLIRAGELKINLVDARGGGMLMSPRETDESDAHHVELLSISGLPEEKSVNPKPDLLEETESDNIRKIQYSFGVVSVPVLKEGESWSCDLEIKWHRSKSVMLYVSLGYSPEGVDQRVNVHRSLQIEGKVPFLINHRFMMPFRCEPLLISNIRSLISPGGEEQKVSLALKENNIVIVSAKNCTEVPLKLVSMKIVQEGSNDSSEKSFVVQDISGISDNIRFVPGEEFRGVYSITPLVANLNLSLGVVCLEWMRESQNQDQPQTVSTKHSLPRVCVEEPPLVAAIECPPFAIVGTPFSLYMKVKNTTSLLQEIKYSLGDSQNFVFCGAHVHSASILPGKEHVLSYKFVALTSGTQQLPKITIMSVRYSAQLTPSVAASTIFVYPSEPKFSLEKNETQLLV